MVEMRQLVLAMLLLVGIGCTPTSKGPPPRPAGVEVSGKLLLEDGTPATGGILVLRPIGHIHGATAPIQEDGTFTLADQSGNKAIVPGRYQVFVRITEPKLKSLAAKIPARYQDSEDGDSDVFVEIITAQSDLTIRLNK
jgi:hypothetical protein